MGDWCAACGEDCWHSPFGYFWCAGCDEHHRQPVAAAGQPCPVDVWMAEQERRAVIDTTVAGLPG